MANKTDPDTLPSFLDMEEVQLTPVDRSTIENYSICPAMGNLCESGTINTHSTAANSGNEAHGVFSSVTQEVIDSWEGYGVQMDVSQIVDLVNAYARVSRPDVQPDVLKAIRACAWEWARFVQSINPKNILAFDGGAGKRSSQFAIDFPEFKARVTSELDFLYATPSVEQVVLVDYKTGHELWTAAKVKASFQFQLHALLVLERFDKVQSVVVQVWNTRVNALTYRVEFTRDDLPAIQSRVKQAVVFWYQFHGKPIESVPKWPAVEKCSLCAAAAKCPVAGADIAEVDANPEAAVDELVALEARADALKKLIGKVVDKRGQDIVTAAGNAYGSRKPKADRKPTKAIYKAPKPGDEPEETEGE